MTLEAVKRLREAAWLTSPGLQGIFQMLDGDRLRTRAVGGCVRDTILNRVASVADIDLATELLPDEVMARARSAGIAAYPTGIEHGTVTLRHGALTVEVTTLRQDIKTDGRRAVVQFGRDWAADASRRDFTMNALYANMDGSLFDPVTGLEDCLAGRVKFIGDAALRIAEDGLRVFRFFRFSASHGGQIWDEPGLAACSAAIGQLDQVSAERIGAEMVRMLGLPNIAKTLSKLSDLGLVSVTGAALNGLAQYEQQQNAANVWVRLALLLDGNAVGELQHRWRLANVDIERAGAAQAAARLLGDGKTYEAVHRWPAAVHDGLALASVLCKWDPDQQLAMAARLASVKAQPFPVSGADLLAMGLSPGPELGQSLRLLEQQWIDSGFQLNREQLLAGIVP